MLRRRVNVLDSVATSSGTTVLLGVAALIEVAVAPEAMPGYGAIGLWILIAAGLFPVLRHFNLTLNGSPLPCAMFMLLQAATACADPDPLRNSLLAATALAGASLLFACFQDRKATQLIFTAMLLCSIGMVYEWAYAALAVAFVIGIFQMRAFSLRGLVAVMLGIATGPLLLYGFGIAELSLPAMPEPLWNADTAQPIHSLVSAAIASAFCLIFGGSCILTSYGYPVRTRAYNGMIYAITICAIVCVAIDLANAAIYLPLLNLCAAYHIGHFAVSRSRGWIGVCTAIAAITALYVWNAWK